LVRHGEPIAYLKQIWSTMVDQILLPSSEEDFVGKCQRNSFTIFYRGSTSPLKKGHQTAESKINHKSQQNAKENAPTADMER